MAVDTKAIKQKIKVVGNVRKVTKTMEMVSIAKMRRAVQRKKNSYNYAKYALDILAKISYIHDAEHVLFNKRKEGKHLLVFMASDKGLCGPYNTRLEKQLVDFISRHTEGIEVITIGNRAAKMAKKYGMNIRKSLPNFADSVRNSDVAQLVIEVRDLYVQDETFKDATFIFTEFISSLQFHPVEKKVLPINKDTLPELFDLKVADPTKDTERYIVEPSKQAIIEEVLPLLVQVTIYQFVLEALASEHSSRMLAMRNASDNASRLKDNLTGHYNRARQAAITKELIEIVNAAAAV